MKLAPIVSQEPVCPSVRQIVQNLYAQNGYVKTANLEHQHPSSSPKTLTLYSCANWSGLSQSLGSESGFLKSRSYFGPSLQNSEAATSMPILIWSVYPALATAALISSKASLFSRMLGAKPPNEDRWSSQWVQMIRNRRVQSVDKNHLPTSSGVRE